MTPGVFVTARSLQLDRMAAEVTGAFAQERFPAILLKGPSVAEWLYDDGAPRPYVDIDLLVPPAAWERARRVLANLGFTSRLAGASPLEHDPFTELWDRHDGMVDLHRAIIGVEADAAKAWSELSARTETLQVGGRRLQVLAPAARALHVALHAAGHGREIRRPLQDLERAVTRVSMETWEEAARIARKIGAVGALATGLRLVPEGRELAQRLELEMDASVDVVLRSITAPPLAKGLLRLARTKGPKAKTRLIVREVFPTPSSLRAWSPLASRGLGGLVAAYLWRPFYLLTRVGPAVHAVRRASSQSRSTRACETLRRT